MVVERMLKYNRIITKGSHLVIPFFETLRPVLWSYDDRQEGPVSFETCRIMTRKTKLALTPVKALTKDSQKVFITFNVVFIISDVKQVVYHGNNLYATIQKLVQSKVKECVTKILIENLTLGQLQESIEQSIESAEKIFEKRGISRVECKILDIQYPPTLTEKKERLEEIELQQELEEKLYTQRSEMLKRQFQDVLVFARENQLDSVVLGKMLSSVILVNNHQ